MNEFEKKIALDVLEKIRKHPCSKAFEKSMSPNHKDYEEYSETIKKIIDLETIHSKVLNNEYKSYQNFLNDFKLLTKNAKKFYKPKDPEYIMSDEIDHILQSLNASALFQHKSWTKYVLTMLEKIVIHMEQAPDSIAKSWDTTIILHALRDMNMEELKDFIAKSAEIKKKSHFREIYRIIQKHNPSYSVTSTTPTIDVDRLSPQTKWIVKWYIENCLEEMNDKVNSEYNDEYEESE